MQVVSLVKEWISYQFVVKGADCCICLRQDTLDLANQLYLAWPKRSVRLPTPDIIIVIKEHTTRVAIKCHCA